MALVCEPTSQGVLGSELQPMKLSILSRSVYGYPGEILRAQPVAPQAHRLIAARNLAWVKQNTIKQTSKKNKN